MGVAQSAQREDRKDAAAAGGSRQVDDGHTDETVQNKEETSVIKRKADGSIEEVNVHCEDEIPAEDQDVSETEKPFKEENRPLENVEDEPLKITEMDAKQNDMYKGFGKIFSNIGLEWTVKRGSSETAPDVPDKSNKEEPIRGEDVKETAKETKSENAEQDTDVNMKQETYDNDSTTCPTLTDVTSEGVLEYPEGKKAETKEAAATTPSVGEDTHQDATSEEEPHSTSPSSPEEEEIVCPIKRFFMSGIFSGLWKKKKPEEVKKHEEELIDMRETQQNVQDQQQDKEIYPAVVEAKQDENELKDENLSIASTQMTDRGRSSSRNLSTIVIESECPLKWLLSGSLKKKKQTSRRSSDSKLFDTTEHISDQLLSPTVTPDNQTDSAQPPAEAAGEEEGTWSSFKKRMNPKKHIKRSSLSNEEIQIPGLEEEPKPSEDEQISDHSTENGKKRKDSSVSWDAVLCGSGRKRSRKTSDSEDEMPQIDINGHKQDNGAKHEAAPPLESSKDDQILASFPKEAGSPSEVDGGSTWKSLKRRLTPKRKVMDEDVSKANTPSYNEVTKASYYDADEDVASGDEDSETPAVVPLSEFNTVEKEAHAQTQADMESHMPEKSNNEFQQDLLDQMTKEVLSPDSLQTEANKVQDNDDVLEKSATPATNEEPDDVSKYQQLSDIPEEGIITETMTTPAEEAARDDTIAEDLIEITSEAITAPEPATDITLADETEMISAVSQLTLESSKTSGNTTPILAEYDIMETDRILHQVVETISVSPKEVAVCSDEQRSERIVSSVSQQILEKVVKEEPTILEMHRRLDAATIRTGLTVEELDAINELAATSQTESISEVKDTVSIEVVSEVSTGELDTAETAVDEIQVVNTTNTEGSEKDLETHHMVKCQSEINPAVSTDVSPEGDKSIADGGSLVEAHQVETQPQNIDSQEADSAPAAIADETKDGAMEQEVLNVTDKEGQIIHNITDQIQDEDTDQLPVEVEELQQLAEEQATTLESEGNAQLHEKEVISKEIPVVEMVIYELKGETVPMTEANAEAEEEDELETDATKTEHDQVSEAAEAVQASILDSEESSVISPEEEVKSEDFPPAETVTDEPKKNTKVTVEPEKKDLPANAVRTEHVPELDAFKSESVQAVTLDSEEGSVQSHKNEVTIKNLPEVETTTDEPREEAILPTEVHLDPMVDSEPGYVQKSEVLEAAQAPTLDLVEGSVESREKEGVSEDVPEGETITDEPKVETVLPTEVSLEPLDASLPEHLQEPEVTEAAQIPIFESEKASVKSIEKEVISEDIPEAETTTDEPKEETVLPTEVSLEPMVDSVPEHVPEPEVLQAVQAATSESEEGSVQALEKEVISEGVPEAETMKDEPKVETVLSTEVSPEPLVATQPERLQELEVTEAVQAPILESKKGSVESLKVVSENVPEAETITDEPKEETVPPTEVNLEPMVDSVPEHVHESEVLQAVQAVTSESEEGSVQALKKEVISEGVPETEITTDEPKVDTVPPTEVSLEAMVDSVPEHVLEPEVLQAVQAATSESEEGSVQALEKEVISEGVPEAETMKDEPKVETVLSTEVSLEPPCATQPEHLQELEVTEAVQAPILESKKGSVESLKVVSENVPEAETITDEPKEETVPPTEVNLEPMVDSVPEHVHESEVLQAVQAATSESEEGSVQALAKNTISEYIPEAKPTSDEPKEDTVLPSEVSLEPVVDSVPEHVPEPEVLQVVQAATSESEEGSVQALKKEVISEGVPETEITTDEPKEDTVPPTEVSLEAMVDSVPEHVLEPEVLQAVQAATSESEEGSVQALEKEVISEGVPEAETMKDEPKVETVLSTEVSPEPLVATQPERLQELEVTEAVQAPILESKKGSVESLKVVSENVPEAETITDEPKEETVPPTEVNLEPMVDSVPEHVHESEVLQAVQAVTSESEEGSVQALAKNTISEYIPEAKPTSDEPKEDTVLPSEVSLEPLVDSVPEHVPEPEVLQVVQAATSESEEGSVQALKKEVISEGVPETEITTDEPKVDTVPPTEVSLEAMVDSVPEHVLEPEVLQAVQAATSESEEGSVQALEKEVISEGVPEAETMKDEPKVETVLSTEVSLEPPCATQPEHLQELEVTEAVQAPILESKKGSVESLKVVSENVPEAETITDEPKEETVPPTEVNLEPMVDSVPEHVHESEVLQAVQAATSESEEGSVQALAKNTISEYIPEAKPTSDEPKEDTVLPSEVSLEPVVDSVPEHVPEPEVLQVVQAATSESEEGSVQALKKEVISEGVPETEITTDEPKEDTVPPTEVSLEAMVDSVPEHVLEPEVLQAVQAATSESEEGSVQALEKEVISEGVPEAETMKDEPKVETVLSTEVSLEPPCATQPEHLQELEVTEAVQAPILESKKGSVESLKKVLSENVPEAETITDEPKEETVPPTEVNLEPMVDSVPEHVHEPEVLQAVEAATSESEEGSVQALQKEIISEGVPETEITTDEPKEDTVPPTEVNLEPMVDSVPEHVLEPAVLQAVHAATSESEEGSVQALEKEVISEGVPEAETMKDEPKEETVLSTEVNPVQESEVLQAAQAPTSNSVEGIVKSPEKEAFSEEVAKAETTTDEPKEETVLPTEINLEPVVDFEPGHVQESEVLQAGALGSEGRSAESLAKEVISENLFKAVTITDEFKEETVLPSEVSLEPKVDSEPEHVQEPEVLQAVQAATLESEEGKVQEEESISDDIPKVVLTEEPKHEVQLSAVQVNVEQEKECEFPGIEIKTAAVQHVVACNLKDACNLEDVSVTVTDLLIEKTSQINEILIDTVATAEVFKEEVEAAEPLAKDHVFETVEDGSEVVMMQVPLVTFEDNQRIQVQVANVNVKSAETIADSVLEVGVTEIKEVIDVCQTVEKVDNLPATPEIEEELINEENKVTIQEVFQYVKEKLPETVPESAAASLEQEVIEKPDDITKAESEISEVDDQTAMEDSTGTFRQREDRASAVISDDSATEQQVSINLMPTPDIPGSLDVSIQDQKEDLEETKASPITKRIVVMEQTDMSKAEVQEVEAEESTKQINSTQRSERQNQTKVPEVTVQTSENTEPAANLDSTERAAIQTQTVILEVENQAMETVEPVEQIKTTDRVTCSVQVTETIQPVRPTEKREVFQSQPVLSDATEPIKQIKDKRDQDEWMDAEEVVHTQEDTEVPFHEVGEHLEPQTPSEQEVKEGLGHEVETAPTFKTDEDKSEQAMHSTGEACGIESEDEDFAVALEDPEIVTASITTEKD